MKDIIIEQQTGPLKVRDQVRGVADASSLLP